MDYLLNLWLPYLILGIFVALALASEIGYRVSRIVLAWYRQGAHPASEDVDDSVNTITNSSLALLALFLGFTFSSAMQHFEINREAVIKEAATISTAYQYSELQPAPYDANIAQQIRDYADLRLTLGVSAGDGKSIKKIARQSYQQQQKIWQSVAQMIRQKPENFLSDSLVASVNEMVASENARTEYLLNNVPNGLFVPVGFFLVFNGVLLGVSLAEGAKRHMLMSWGLYLLVALAVGIIVDLNRPLSGLINVDQQAMLAMRNKM